MKITAEQVRHVAKLARLKIDSGTVDKMAGQLATILDYVDKLNEVDTRQVEPTFHAVRITNAFRQDRVHAHLPRQAALDNAPAKDDGSFVVPKVI